MTSGVEPTSRSVGRARTRNLRSNSKSPYPGSLIPGVYLRDRPKGGPWAGPAARSAQVRRASLGSLLLSGRGALGDPVLERIPVSVGVRIGGGDQHTLNDQVAVIDVFVVDP